MTRRYTSLGKDKRMRADIRTEIAEALANDASLVNDAVESIAALSGGEGGVPMGFDSYDATTVYSATASTAAVVANTLYAVPFFLANAATLGAFRIYVTSGSAGNARLGCYAAGADGADGMTFRKPTTLIVDGGQQSTASNGSKYFGLDPVYDLDAGLYFLVAVFSGTPTVQVLTATSCGWGMSPAANPATYKSGITESFTYGALPADFPGFKTAVVTAMPQIIATLS